jgi:hypothetical protein
LNGGRALGCVQNSQPSAGAGADVKKTAPFADRLYDSVHRFRDLRNLTATAGATFCIFVVDDSEDSAVGLESISTEAGFGALGKQSPSICCEKSAGPYLPRDYALNELPQPHVLFTFGLLNLKPEPSSVST